MAKAKRVKTRYRNVYRVGKRYEWLGRHGVRGMADSATEARDAKAAADRKQPAAADIRSQRFGEYALDWIDAYQGRTRRGFSESSRIGYRSQLERWLIPYFDTVRPRKFAQVSKPDVRALIAWLADPNRKGLPDGRAGEEIAPVTVERILAPLKAMYAQAIDDEVIPPGNPASVRVNLQPAEIDPEADDEDRRAFTVDELERVLAAPASDCDRLLLDTLAELGARWGEVCEWRGKDLHVGLEGPVLRVRRAYSAKTGKVKPTKSGYGRRDLPLSPELARRLWRLQRKPGELLFTSPLGDRLNYTNTYRRVLQPLLKRASDAGDTDVTWAAFHTLRHTCASLLFAEGRNPKQVQEWLGHSDPGFTLRTYVHLLADGMGGPLILPTVPGAVGGQRNVREPLNPTETEVTAESADLRG